MYFIVNLPFIPVWRLTLNSPDSEVLQLSVLSEAPTDLNADAGKKFRVAEWLISTILLEINQLEGGAGWNVTRQTTTQPDIANSPAPETLRPPLGCGSNLPCPVLLIRGRLMPSSSSRTPRTSSNPIPLFGFALNHLLLRSPKWKRMSHNRYCHNATFSRQSDALPIDWKRGG
jgi:hypothetical protein